MIPCSRWIKIKNNDFLLPRDTFMPEMHLRQPGFMHRACMPFKKTKQEYKNSKKQETPGIPTGMK